MEENHKALELGGLSNSQLVEQFKRVISGREVDNIYLFVTFKPKTSKNGPQTEKNLQEKTYQTLNSLKQKKQQEQVLERMRTTFSMNIKKLTVIEQAAEMYESGNFQRVIEILTVKEQELSSKLTVPVKGQLADQGKRRSHQYNTITFYLGNSYFRLKNFTKATEYYLKNSQEEPLKQRAQRMNNLGTCHAVKKSYQLALKYYNQAIKCYNDCPEEDVSSLLNNIAMIYLKCEMYKQAEQFFSESIQQRKNKSPNNKSLLYNSFYNLGISQKRIGKYEECLSSFFVALNYAYEGHGGKLDVLSEICTVYEEQERWSEALCSYQKLSEQYEKSNKPQGSIYQRVSKIHLRMGNLLLANKFAKNAYKQYRAAGDERKMSEISCSVAMKAEGQD